MTDSDAIEVRLKSWAVVTRPCRVFVQMGARWAKGQRRKIRMRRKKRRGWA